MEYEFKIVELKPQSGLAIREEVAFSEIPAKMAEFFGELGSFFGARRITPVGPPFTFYHSWNDKVTVMEVGFPVGPGAAGQGRVGAMTLPGGRVVTGTHIGPYDKLPEAYTAMAGWMKSHGHSPADHMWEVYLSDPQVEKDPKKWVTLMYWPIA